MTSTPPRARRSGRPAARRAMTTAAAAVLAATVVPTAVAPASAATAGVATRSLSPVASSTGRVTVIDAASAEVLRLVNVERAKVGCPAVRWEPRLATAARLHSQDMANKRYFSHDSLDGRSPWDRIKAQGYAYGSAENIAAGQQTAAAVMTAWMKSTGHKANILACSNRALGVGVGRGGPYGIYWTQDFGSR
ncbi:CAP domain-containing protein [Oryzobacter terrae]|uniref:CAP domain-containing protein n=1 Tax=Oryzobacter terrae TaxID=1620385 RepID=UPI00366FD2A6